MRHGSGPRALRLGAGALLGVAVLAGLPEPAKASPFELIYTGFFHTSDVVSFPGVDTTFPGVAFTAKTFFDNSSPNLAAGLGVPGFAVYASHGGTITMGGHTYDILPNSQTDPSQNLNAAIFDQTTPFGPPGHDAAGFLQFAPDDGFVGDFLAASPPFTTPNLQPTTFTGYVGVGMGPASVPLEDSVTHQLFTLNLSAWPDLDYDPTITVPDPRGLNTAQLLVPEPGTLALLGGAVLGLLGLRRRLVD